MGNKLFWLLLSAFLLAQCCQALPANEDSNDVLELKQKISYRSVDFLGKFDQRLERFVAKLSGKEKDEYSNFLDWYKQYNDEHALKQKTVLLRKFVEKRYESQNENA